MSDVTKICPECGSSRLRCTSPRGGVSYTCGGCGAQVTDPPEREKRSDRGPTHGLASKLAEIGERRANRG